MFRQLDQRHGDSSTITLEWDPATGAVQLRYEDHASPEASFSYPVEPRDARIAFLHPFSLRASDQGTDVSAACPGPGQGAPTKRRRRWFRKRSAAEFAEDPSGRSWLRWLQHASGAASDYNWLGWPPQGGGTSEHHWP